MWSDVFAVPGKRTSGTTAASFAVVPVGWKGNPPDGVTIIQSPTPYVWIIERTQTNGPSDYDTVHKIQDGFRITPVSQWGKTPYSPRLTCLAMVENVHRCPQTDSLFQMCRARWSTSRMLNLGVCEQLVEPVGTHEMRTAYLSAYIQQSSESGFYCRLKRPGNN